MDTAGITGLEKGRAEERLPFDCRTHSSIGEWAEGNIQRHPVQRAGQGRANYVLLFARCPFEEEAGQFIVPINALRMVLTMIQKQLQSAILDLCDSSIQPLTLDPPSGKHWRTNAVLFKDENTMNLRMDPGAACYSPCWLEQGNPNHPPGPSATLMNNAANLSLLKDTQEVAALMGGILSVVHPALFQRGMDVWKTLYADPWGLRNGDRVRDLLDLWATPFTAMSVIANRETPHHRDLNGGLNFFDAILSFGTYEDGRFELPEIGRRFRYDRGTAIFLESRSLQHGASAVVGERCCIVLFFRPLMLRRELPEAEMDPEEVPMPSLSELRAAVRRS